MNAQRTAHRSGVKVFHATRRPGNQVVTRAEEFECYRFAFSNDSRDGSVYVGNYLLFKRLGFCPQ